MTAICQILVMWPQHSQVEAFGQLLLNREAQIYDAGCGTGQIGTLLQAQGYQQIHGADFSPEMLERARQTGAYAQL